jgi:hypothetical protein
MSLFSAVWPLKDLGDLTKKGDVASSLALALCLPVCAAGAAGIIAADGLKAPTAKARVLVGACLGATVAGTATTGLSGNRFPQLALISLVCGAALGFYGAHSLRADTAAPAASSERRRTAEPRDRERAERDRGESSTGAATGSASKAAPAADGAATSAK